MLKQLPLPCCYFRVFLPEGLYWINIEITAAAKLCDFLTYHVIIPIIPIANGIVPRLTVYTRRQHKQHTEFPKCEQEPKSSVYGLLIINRSPEKNSRLTNNVFFTS